MFKTVFIFFLILIANNRLFAQEVPSDGLLYPRVTTAQRILMPANAAEGIHVYDTDTKSDWMYDGSDWINKKYGSNVMQNMTEAQRDALVSPKDGMLIFNTNSQCLQFYKNPDWSDCLLQKF